MGGGKPVLLLAPGSLPIIFKYSISSALAPALVAAPMAGPCEESCHAPKKKTKIRQETKAARKFTERVFTIHQPIF
jgi:hypothetical protein